MQKKKPKIILKQYVGLKMEVDVLREMNSPPEKIREKQQEVERIDQALENIEDPMHRAVLLLYYINGRMVWKWPQVAVRLYGNADEAEMKAVQRLHGRALQSFDREYKKLKKESHP